MKSDLDDRSVTVGSANVFADLGIPEPDLAMKKTNVASKIRETIREREWTQTEAAKVMGIDQPKVSAIVRGRVGDFTLDRLIQLATKLGQMVYVDVIGPDIERRVTRSRGVVTIRYSAKVTRKTSSTNKAKPGRTSKAAIR